MTSRYYGKDDQLLLDSLKAYTRGCHQIIGDDYAVNSFENMLKVVAKKCAYNRRYYHVYMALSKYYAERVCHTYQPTIIKKNIISHCLPNSITQSPETDSMLLALCTLLGGIDTCKEYIFANHNNTMADKAERTFTTSCSACDLRGATPAT